VKAWSGGAVIVTGGSRGIGAEIVRLLAQRGVPVCINHRDSATEAESLASEVRSLGGKACVVQADVGSEADVLRLFTAAEQELGALWGLVNNAGYVGLAGRRVDEAQVAVLEQSFRVNVIGPMICAREALLRISPRHGGQGGRIVNISSIASRTGSPNDFVDYAASKAALNTFTLGLAREVAMEGVQVNGVSPGIADTEINARAGAPERKDRLAAMVPMKRPARPAEVAEVTVWLLLDAPDYLHGTTVDVGGGL